ncbi:MAG: class I SAM-dependent methyltransferase [Bacteroidia bacterium]|nr:class I SAM-dependent methyltransferase [Bacteroidia bacterium]
MTEIKNHWDKIYLNKKPDEMSWIQDIPRTSLAFIRSANLDMQDRIIDIGGGNSNFVDFLLDFGYKNITVLDISEQALLSAQQRLGVRANKVKWIVSDITNFRPDTTYSFWHDRATFHFLTSEEDILKYLSVANHAVMENGFASIGTFSTQGPTKCSGLEIKQYSEETLAARFQNGFKRIKCITEDHTTPFNTIQNFLFCLFKKLP